VGSIMVGMEGYMLGDEMRKEVTGSSISYRRKM
jgi:hypothetical protein